MNKSLVPVTPINRNRDKRHSASRPDSGFVAHLIATRTQAPQTRTRRRAEPSEAVSAYARLGHWPSAAGRIMSRSL